jgi:hypothetical protein
MAMIESRLVISAADQTAAAFASVEARIKQMQATLASVNPAAASVGRAAANVSPAQRSVAASGGGAVETMLGIAAAVTGVQAVTGGFKEAAAQQHEKMRETLQNVTAAQIAQGEKAAAELSKKYPSIAQSDLMHMFRTGLTVTGSAEESLAALEPMARLRVIAQAARPGASAEEQTEEMDKLLKSAEIKGVATDPGRFKSYISAVAKTLNAFGDQLKPSDIFEQLKYARQASQSLSERFVATTMSTIGSEIGGAGIGTAVASFNRAMVGGHMEHQAALELAGLGLINEDDLTKLSTGEVKGVKRGAHVKDWRLAQSDPDLWIRQNLIPALEAHGYKSDDEMQAEIAKLYPNRTAGQFVSQIVGQRSKMEKNAALWQKSMSDEAADVLTKSDINAATSGFGNRVENLIASNIPADALAKLVNAATAVISTTVPTNRNILADLEKGLPPIAAAARERTDAALTDADLERSRRSRMTYHPGGWVDDPEAARGRALSHLIEGGHATAAPPQEVNVTGQATVTGNFTVTASSELLRIINQNVQTSTQVPLNPVQGGHSGRMDSDAAPLGHSGIGHQ